MKRTFVRPVYFIWIVVPVALYLIYLVFGLPHFIWSYSWFNHGQGQDPFANRFYTRCTFIGPYGEFTIRHPSNGKCGWFVFRKQQNSNKEAAQAEKSHDVQ